MEIICYACGRGENPENTIEGIAHCQSVDPEWRIEMDLHMTADGEIILFHDHYTLRTTGVDLEIAKTPLSEIKKLDAGHYFSGAEDKIYHVPTLKEVLEQFSNIRLLLDVHTPDVQAIAPILELIENYQPKDLVIASQYDHIIAGFREKAPSVRYGAAAKEAKKLIYSSFLGMDGLFPVKGDVLIIPKLFGKIKVLTPRIVRHVQKRNKTLWAWVEESEVVKTAESLDEVKMLESLGANAAFSEFPERIKQELNA